MARNTKLEEQYAEIFKAPILTEPLLRKEMPGQPKFDKNDRVCIKSGFGVLSEMCGVIRKVQPGTGFNAQRSFPARWSTPHMYTVDFGLSNGALEIQEWPLEHAPT